VGLEPSKAAVFNLEGGRNREIAYFDSWRTVLAQFEKTQDCQKGKGGGAIGGMGLGLPSAFK
jgi:hypothetical protein